VYALLTGNRAPDNPRNMLNRNRTGIYRMPRGGSSWTLLRGTIQMVAGKRAGCAGRAGAARPAC
jgi:hypothetical protein